jgi:hypothetical protein
VLDNLTGVIFHGDLGESSMLSMPHKVLSNYPVLRHMLLVVHHSFLDETCPENIHNQLYTKMSRVDR